MARIPIQRRVVHPTNPRIAIPVADERGWIDGPGTGRWWHRFAWWVIPLGLVLLVTPWYLYFTTTPPTTPTRHHAAPRVQPPAARLTPVTTPAPVDLTPVGEGLKAVADAVSHIQPPPAPAPAPAERNDGDYNQTSPPPTNPCTNLAPIEERRCRILEQLPLR